MNQSDANATSSTNTRVKCAKYSNQSKSIKLICGEYAIQKCKEKFRHKYEYKLWQIQLQIKETVSNCGI